MNASKTAQASPVDFLHALCAALELQFQKLTDTKAIMPDSVDADRENREAK